MEQDITRERETGERGNEKERESVCVIVGTPKLVHNIMKPSSGVCRYVGK